MTDIRHGGDLIADVLKRWGVPYVFTLCGGHISPILVGAQTRGIKVIDCRDEKNAVFAADAVARMTGVPGVAAVTAGPGVTNALTALKNAQMAQSPVIDVSAYTTVHLQYWRWLSVEDARYDQATILLNGQLAWENPRTRDGTLEFIDRKATNWSKRFYRASEQR